MTLIKGFLELLPFLFNLAALLCFIIAAIKNSARFCYIGLACLVASMLIVF